MTHRTHRVVRLLNTGLCWTLALFVLSCSGGRKEGSDAGEGVDTHEQFEFKEEMNAEQEREPKEEKTPNPVPVLSGPMTAYLVGGFKREIVIEGRDEDGLEDQLLSYCLVSGPNWAEVSGQGAGSGSVLGTLVLSPADEDRGSYEIEVGLAEGENCPGEVMGQHSVTVFVGKLRQFERDFAYLEIAFMGDEFFFPHGDGEHGVELWKSDGTKEGTVLVKDISVADGYLGSSNPAFFPKVIDDIFFRCRDGVHGVELWKTDGSENGTLLVKDIWPGEDGSNPGSGMAHEGELFFWADDGTHGKELWKTDGTEENTVLVKDIRPGEKSSYWIRPYPYIHQPHVSIGNQLLFVANDGVHGRELWKTDGTEDGTLMIKDIAEGEASSIDGDRLGDVPLVALAGFAYFPASDEAHGEELWRTDGTEEGTTLVKDIREGVESCVLSQMVVMNERLFFVATDGIHGLELWRSDGTEESTEMVKDFCPGENSSILIPLMVASSRFVYYQGYLEEMGQELVKSDGTDEGTTLVKDIWEGLSGSAPSNFIVFNEQLLFEAYEPVAGIELWISDGSASGTHLFFDLQDDDIGPPDIFAIHGQTIFFQQHDSYGPVWLIEF